jgi:V8-like Glu-specific endopeptidase
MRTRKTRSIILRHTRVFKRGFTRLTSKKVLRWFLVNLKGHPFILGLVMFIWLNWVFNRRLMFTGGAPAAVLFYVGLFGLWVFLVVLSNFLKEDQRNVKWYLKKRFIMFMLFIFSPFGIILLWSGSKFRKSSKIVLTIIFVTLFLFSRVYYKERYDHLKDNAFLDDIVELISKPKKTVFLKKTPDETLKNIKLTGLTKKEVKQLTISDITSRSSSAIASIKTKDKNGNDIGMGSGFVVSEDGIIATNFHVLESAYQAEVKIGEKTYKEVYFIKGAPEVDIALIKVDARGLKVLPIGNSDTLLNGQSIVVLGNPWGLERTVTNGLVSAVRSQENIKLIQMSAPVSPGSSGGPVLNEAGEVVGITTIASFLFAQNLNFAIPINYLDKLIKE